MFITEIIAFLLPGSDLGGGTHWGCGKQGVVMHWTGRNSQTFGGGQRTVAQDGGPTQRKYKPPDLSDTIFPSWNRSCTLSYLFRHMWEQDSKEHGHIGLPAECTHFLPDTLLPHKQQQDLHFEANESFKYFCECEGTIILSMTLTFSIDASWNRLTWCLYALDFLQYAFSPWWALGWATVWACSCKKYRTMKVLLIKLYARILLPHDEFVFCENIPYPWYPCTQLEDCKAPGHNWFLQNHKPHRHCILLLRMGAVHLWFVKKLQCGTWLFHLLKFVFETLILLTFTDCSLRKIAARHGRK